MKTKLYKTIRTGQQTLVGHYKQEQAPQQWAYAATTTTKVMKQWITKL
jgi:hypothetical protein